MIQSRKTLKKWIIINSQDSRSFKQLILESIFSPNPSLREAQYNADFQYVGIVKNVAKTKSHNIQCGR